jgi:hypothetical protein
VYLRVIPAIEDRANMQEIGPFFRIPARYAPNSANFSTTSFGESGKC